MLVKNNSTISPMISPSDNNNNEPVKTTGKTSNDTKSNESPYPYPVKSVTINTCSSLYQNWAKTKKLLYAKALNGLTIPVEYADNIDILSPNEKRSFVTILALHGAPGSHEDFKSYIQHFTRKNIRIIVPNYPGLFLFSFLSIQYYFELVLQIVYLIHNQIIRCNADRLAHSIKIA